jgi:hypothetical protein
MIDYTLTEDEKADLRERGALMNGPESVRYIVVHCSATPVTADYTVEQMTKDHKLRGFRTIGYHFYIRKDGAMTQHRKLLEVGAHCKPFNRCSIGVCYEGGIDPQGNPSDTRTEALTGVVGIRGGEVQQRQLRLVVAAGAESGFRFFVISIVVHIK